MSKKIGVLLICTGKYDIFLQPLVNNIDKNFFEGNDIEIYLFSDKEHDLKKSDRINIVHIPTSHKPFPYPTLYRYKYFTEAADKINCDFIFYMDVDMSIADKVGEEILPDLINDEGLVATLHPGFYRGGGSWGDNIQSKSYTLPKNRNKYYAGGFNGGETKAFLKMSKILSDNIDDDESRGVIAEHNDETHINWYLSTRTPKTLTPEYCQVEEIFKRKKWGVNNFKPRIIALKKNHAKLRSDA